MLFYKYATNFLVINKKIKCHTEQIDIQYDIY